MIDEILFNLQTDLYRACCTQEGCDGWHPKQDEEDERTLSKAREQIRKAVDEILGEDNSCGFCDDIRQKEQRQRANKFFGEDK